MDQSLRDIVLRVTGADSILGSQRVQSLWSGYGEILRVKLGGADRASVIVKHVAPPTDADHPRGWATDLSHQRKLRSYQVESNWYRDWSDRCSSDCRVPACLHVQPSETQAVFVLEDLDAVGFSLRKSALRGSDVQSCLRWLAEMHAIFMNCEPNESLPNESWPDGLWPVGTYWHLETRPDEWNVMESGELKQKAKHIDETLSNCYFQTLVHGDAKVANFCFADSGSDVAAVDFQYVGGGCGIKDVAYFLGSCLSENECEQREDELLGYYFDELTKRLAVHHPQVDASEVQAEWRSMYCFAWADFNRFLLGWCPGHHKLTGYSQRMTSLALGQVGA